MALVPGSMICVTDLPLVRWSGGIDRDSTWNENSHKLATYLGHVHINETYWYLEAVPELFQLATNRLLDNGKEARR